MLLFIGSVYTAITCARNDEDSWVKAQHPDSENVPIDPIQDDPEVDATSQASDDAADAFEIGWWVIEANLRCPITVKRYDGAAGQTIPPPQSAAHGYSMYNSASQDSENVYWPFTS